MRRDSLRTIGLMFVVIAIAVLVICFDNIKAMMNEAMIKQADSLVNQLLR